VGLRITIDTSKCMGSGNCLFWAPGVFGLSDDGVAFVAHPDSADADERKVRQAADGCPTQAISVIVED
jgi:ferredoxin